METNTRIKTRATRIKEIIKVKKRGAEIEAKTIIILILLLILLGIIAFALTQLLKRILG